MSDGPDAPGLGRLDRWRLGAGVSAWRVGRFARAALTSALKPRVRTFIILGVVGLPLVVALAVSQILTDALWFREVGQEDAFVRMEATQLVLVLVVGGFTAAFLIGNALIAIRADRSPASRRYAPAAVTGCALVAAMIGWGARGDWQVGLLGVNRQAFRGEGAALRGRGPAPSPRHRLLRLHTAAPREALGPPHPDRGHRRGGDDRDPLAHGRPDVATAHSDQARPLPVRAAREPGTAPARLAPAPCDLLRRAGTGAPRTEPGVPRTALRRRPCPHARPARSLLRGRRVGDRASGGAVPSRSRSWACSETGGDRPRVGAGGRRDRLGILGPDTGPALRGQQRPGQKGGSLPRGRDSQHPSGLGTGRS